MTKNIWNISMQLLVSNMLEKGARIVFSLFLSVYIWQNTWDIKTVALFNIYFLLLHLVGFLGASFFVKSWYKKVINHIWFLGLIFSYILVILLWDSIIYYIYPIAWIVWIFNGMYHMNYNASQFEFTTFENRGNFEGLKKALKTITKIILPSIFGVLISLHSINLAFGFGILLFSGGAIYLFDFELISFMAKQESLNEFSIYIHGWVSVLIYPLFALHILAAINHQIFGVLDE